MKHIICLCVVLGVSASLSWAAPAKAKPVKISTVRGETQYLSTDPAAVEDTCPGRDIFNRYTCPAGAAAGTTCFDVYRVQGDPAPEQRYTLLHEDLSTPLTTAEPACNFDGELTCENFLHALHYNLDFSWFIDNFPSSSFPQCQETYTCTRLACFRPLDPLPDGQPRSQKLSCVFKKNQIYFLGNEITCTAKNASPRS